MRGRERSKGSVEFSFFRNSNENTFPPKMQICTLFPLNFLLLLSLLQLVVMRARYSELTVCRLTKTRPPFPNFQLPPFFSIENVEELFQSLHLKSRKWMIAIQEKWNRKRIPLSLSSFSKYFLGSCFSRHVGRKLSY